MNHNTAALPYRPSHITHNQYCEFAGHFNIVFSGPLDSQSQHVTTVRLYCHTDRVRERNKTKLIKDKTKCAGECRTRSITPFTFCVRFETVEIEVARIDSSPKEMRRAQTFYILAQRLIRIASPFAMILPSLSSLVRVQ